MADLLQNFRFEVTLTRSATPAPADSTPARLGNGAFAECTGLELTADVREHLEGGRNDGIVRRVGRVQLVPLVLKRGMLVTDDVTDTALWDWLTGMVSGRLPIPRYDGVVAVHDPSGARTLARWTFDRGLPSRVTGPTLNAKTGEIAVEELHIVHEGLRLEPPS